MSQKQGNPMFMEQAIALAQENVVSGKGGPFGAVVVRGGEAIAAAANSVFLENDPTAHAEVTAIRQACTKLGSFRLTGCEIYSSCEPCPMCLAAIYWAHCDALYFAATSADAAGAGFDDAFLYSELRLPISERRIPAVLMMRDQAQASFELWKRSPHKVEY